ncbi:NAD(P)-dependent oxidoreductase [Novosphingobium sp. AP12]|uniref:NAD(P)-dependent oxidoreductase n=1 Tax=Novosphingobium sp. AP12 TaxID=1144305 RepID=UPI000271F142|nr:NAD(P)-dependent oxidoreductase [Novosphingobium sp. AP12]EJL31138.1 beta-hydroxyacid dehydrogenase, 3-hydroxyisobutyrate dehydrogenase [Novosphingobium sp. AP12]
MTAIRTGFIGIGSQGGPMAHRMLARFPLTVWARRPEAAAAFAEAGAEVAGSVEELGAACDHVGLCVVNDADVLDICAKLVPAMKSGSLLALHSTVLPETAEAVERLCAARGVAMVDAPVSGGSPGAQAGTMTVMCGGSAEAFEQAQPVFESFGKLIVLLGPVGAGQKAKIVNNALMAANMGLAQAALQAGEALGVERRALAELVNASSGRSFGFEVYARVPEPRAFEHGARMLLKDTDLLAAILPGSPDTQLLETSAKSFLLLATG